MKDAKKPQGIKEIAKLAGVSIGTVDRVIHDRAGVSLKTKEKILKIIKEVGYDPNPIARRLAGFSKVYTIAVIIPMKNEFNPYWNQHLSGIEQAKKLVGQFGIEVSPIFYDQQNESSFDEATREFMNREFSACVLTPIFQEKSRTFVEECTLKKIPVVCIDTDLTDSPKLAFIGQDAYQSGLLAGKISGWRLKKGDKAVVCHVTRRATLPQNFEKRENGFRDYLTKERGIADSDIITFKLNNDNEGTWNEEFKKLFLKHKNIKTLFIPNTRSFKLIPALDKQLTKDLFVVGYDLVEENIALLKNNTVDVLISQKPEEQCYKGISFLYKKMIVNVEPDPVCNIPIDIILKENIEFYIENNRLL